MFANTLDNSSFKEYYSARMQVTHHKVDVFRAIASFEEAENLKEGDTVNRPYRSKMVGQSYTRGTAFTVRDLTNTNEQLTVTTARIAPFYIDDLDQLQSQHDNMNRYADDSVIVLGNEIDGDVLGEYANARQTISNADITSGGSSAHGFTLTTSNVQKVFTVAKKKLRRKNVLDKAGVQRVPSQASRGKKNLFAVISPDFEAVLLDFLAGKESQLGDSTSMSGHMGQYYGFDLYVSNSLSWTGTLSMAAQPTDGDTVVIAVANKETVTFTFKTTLGSTAGNVLIGASADAARVNLTGSINSPAANVGSESIALSATLGTSGFSPRDTITGFVATDSPSLDTMTIVAEGVSYVTVSETFTDATDTWTAAKQVQHQLFGVKGAVEVIIQSAPKVEVKEVPDKLGKNIAPWTLYGLKTFNEGKDMLLDVMIRSDAF